jgi:hypothetical protein
VERVTVIVVMFNPAVTPNFSFGVRSTYNCPHAVGATANRANIIITILFFIVISY